MSRKPNENLVDNKINDDEDSEDYTKLIIAVLELPPLLGHRVLMSNRYELVEQ